MERFQIIQKTSAKPKSQIIDVKVIKLCLCKTNAIKALKTYDKSHYIQRLIFKKNEWIPDGSYPIYLTDL